MFWVVADFVATRFMWDESAAHARELHRYGLDRPKDITYGKVRDPDMSAFERAEDKRVAEDTIYALLDKALASPNTPTDALWGYLTYNDTEHSILVEQFVARDQPRKFLYKTESYPTKEALVKSFKHTFPDAVIGWNFTPVYTVPQPDGSVKTVRFEYYDTWNNPEKKLKFFQEISTDHPLILLYVNGMQKVPVYSDFF